MTGFTACILGDQLFHSNPGSGMATWADSGRMMTTCLLITLYWDFSMATAGRFETNTK